MSADKKTATASQEYLAKDRGPDGRTEFYEGKSHRVISGSHLHTLLATNFSGELRHRLKGSDCYVLNCDMRLFVKGSGLYAYPDVQVVLGSPAFADETEDTLLNPKVIVEVLSDNSAAWDQGGKFWHYRHLDSLNEYMLVSHRTWLVDHYVKQSSGSWMLKTVEGKEGNIQLVSAKCQLPLSEIYGNTPISPTATPSAEG
ncbi:MAG: Uma2 family endonuclease [Boseongicola sp.]|nr:Uma2 family endonuclease [Boseongicola sp.]